MIYDCYKDMHLSGDRAFPLKGTYNTLNMSLRHVARHAGLSFNPTIHMARHCDLFFPLKMNRLQSIILDR